MLDRTHRELTHDDVGVIARTYRSWRDGRKTGKYADEPGFCKSVKLEEIRKHNHILTPGRYVDAKPQPDADEPFERKMSKLVAQWGKQQTEAKRLDVAIIKNMADLGFPVRRDKN